MNNILVGDLTSRTTLGDLNYDGRTSLADWSILRAAHGAGAGLDLGALLAGVPEPSAAALAWRWRRWQSTDWPGGVAKTCDFGWIIGI